MYTFIGLVILALGAFPLVKTLIGMNKKNLDERLPLVRKKACILIAVPVAVIYGLLSGALWDNFLLFARQHPTELADPVFNAATGFYLFTLPFLSSVQGLLSFLVVIAVASYFFILFMPGFRQSGGGSDMTVQERLGKTYRQLFILLALFFGLLVWDAWLEIFGLMYSTTGTVVGAGYTQIHVTRLGYYGVMIIYSALALMFIAGAVSERVYRLIMGPMARGNGFEGIPNRYTSYDGSGGVRIDSLVKRVIYSWRFDSYRLLFSGYITRESRVLFRRDITARLNRVAPFLRFDRDPYAVLTGEGSLVYIVDAYTVSDRYPYSEEYRGRLEFAEAEKHFENLKDLLDRMMKKIEYQPVTPFSAIPVLICCRIPHASLKRTARTRRSG